MNKQNFVIFGMGRTGSSLLKTLLDSHPRICCEGEIFHIKQWRRHQRPIVRFWRHYPQPYLFYRRLRARVFLAKSVYGFKLHTKLTSSQLADMDGFLHTAHRTGWKIIHLQRASIFDQAVSSEVARLTHRYHGRHGTPEPAGQVTISESRFRSKLEMIAAIRADHGRILSDIPHITVMYEDDLAQEDAWLSTVSRVCEYLEIPPPVQIETHLKKPWGRPYSDVVANYHEIAEIGKAYRDVMVTLF